MKVNGKDYPIYYGKIKNVPNHQIWFYHGVYWCLIMVFINNVVYNDNSYNGAMGL